MAGVRNPIRILLHGASLVRLGVGFGLLASVTQLSGCASRPRPADASIVTPANAATQAAIPETPPPRTPDSAHDEIDALLHDLRVQKERVDRELARKEQLAVARAEEAEAAEPDAAPAPAPKAGHPARSKKKDAPGAPSARPREEAERESSSDWVGGPCDTACRALASMERSAERICALAGEGDARCENARAMVKTSRERIQASGCWCRSFGQR